MTVPTAARTCPHIPPEHYRAWAPVACDACRGFVDHDGTLIDPELARRRYPALTELIDGQEAAWGKPAAAAPSGTPRGRQPWKVWLAVVAIAGVVIGIIAAAAGGSGSPSDTSRAPAPAAASPAVPPPQPQSQPTPTPAAAPTKATLSATGCASQLAVGDQMTIRASYQAADAGRYTVVWLDGADDFTRNAIYDETLTDAASNDVSGEFVLPGPHAAGARKTIVATLTAKSAGNDDITLTVWPSGDFNSGPPSDAPSLSCSVAINP